LIVLQASNHAAPSESNNHSDNTVYTQANYRQKVYAPYLSRVKNQASRAREMERQAVANRYSHGTDTGESLYKGAIAMMPQGSQKAMESVLLLSKADVLADANVNIRNFDDISGSTPSASKISEWVYNGAADSKFLASQEILSKKCKVYLICDKGALKTANAHFVKLIAWCNIEEGRIKIFDLDADDSDGTSEQCAEVLKHSIFSFFGPNDEGYVSARLNGQTTDSGGGGTLKSLHQYLEKQNLCVDGDDYLVGPCTLHCLQLILFNAIVTLLGKGGKKNEQEYCAPAMQLLHGLYSIQDYHDRTEWINNWAFAAEQVGEPVLVPPTIPKPILTR
jgi:hypothetical protein